MSKAILTWDGFFIWYNGNGGEHSGKTEPHHRRAKNPILPGFLFICYLLSLIGTTHYLTRYLNQFISHGRLGVSIMMRSFFIPWNLHGKEKSQPHDQAAGSNWRLSRLKIWEQVPSYFDSIITYTLRQRESTSKGARIWRPYDQWVRRPFLLLFHRNRRSHLQGFYQTSKN